MTLSQELFTRAQRHIPGGVNSPVRAFKGVGGEPVFIKQGRGAYLIDVDNKHYIDYVGSWGPMILGYGHPKVIDAVHKSIEMGISFGAPTELEIQLAEKVNQLMPSIEMVRMVNSGTEATMSAIRLARGFTNRNKIIKFEGCYHGHTDALLVSAGSGALTCGVPSSPGVPKSFTEHTLVATFNDLQSVHELFETHADDIAAIIVEPVAGNMNCILPAAGFLEGLRELCDQHRSVLIFDEVMTGFRVALGGAQAYFDVTPDLTCLGKIIGGGFPVGAFGGKRAIMEHLAPLGPVYQAGTLSGNPVAMAAGLATLNEISEVGFYEKLAGNTQKLVTEICDLARSHDIAMTANQIGGMFGLFFSKEEAVTNYSQVMQCDQELFKQFFHGMLQHGVYLAPSAFEAGFVSSAHQSEELELTLSATDKVFADL